MSSEATRALPRAPKRERGKQRVEQLLRAAAEVFSEKGYEAATMTEIAARADAPIGSLYQFFPAKESLADTLVQRYVALLMADLDVLEARANTLTPRQLAEGVFGLFRSHIQERAATIRLAEARMDEGSRRTTFRYMLRRRIATILRRRCPALSTERSRDSATVVLQLTKAADALHDEEGLQGRAAAVADLQELAENYLSRLIERVGSARG